MPILLGGGLCVVGAMLIGLAYHNTYTDAWNVLIGKDVSSKSTPAPSTSQAPNIQQTPFTQSHGVA